MEAAVDSCPIVVNDTLYVGSANYNFYALNAEDGSVRWKYMTAGMIRSSPIYLDGTVFIASYDNYLYAFNTVEVMEARK